MTSERRAFLIVAALTLAAGASYGSTVEHWTSMTICGLIAASASTFAAGLSKSPRDGKLADEAAEAVVSSTTVASTSTETVSTVPPPTVERSE